MARRKLSAIPWGAVSPGIEIVNGVAIPVLEIDDVSGILYSNGIALSPSMGGADTIQTFSVSSVIVLVGGGGNTLVLCTGGAGGGITVSLPLAAGVPGQRATVKKVDTGVGPIALVPQGADTIDGLSGYGLSGLNQYVVVESDGTIWQVVGNN